MDRPWFDSDTGMLLLDEYVQDADSYRSIMEDAVISDTELAEQSQKVVSLLRKLEGMLSPEAKAVATDALRELSVLSILQSKWREGGQLSNM